MIKEHICLALGYPVPASFRKTQPRFPGPMFDTYVQKSNNLQIWNEELSPTRRYVLIRVDGSDVVTRVKVVTGDTLARLDTTGCLTQKYQARCVPGVAAELVDVVDSTLLAPFVASSAAILSTDRPNDQPQQGRLLTIAGIFERLQGLLGAQFSAVGAVQERNRGAALHELVTKALGFTTYGDDGQFPDIRQQLLEVKLQTSPTIDLGIASPSSTEEIDVPMMGDAQIRHCDVRYAIFYGTSDGETVTLTHVMVVTGEHFHSRFPQFNGRVLNKKLQIPLPATFFA